MSECGRSNDKAFEFASHDLRENGAFVLEAVQVRGVRLEHASESLRGTAIRQSVLALVLGWTIRQQESLRPAGWWHPRG